ncbi:Crp/Fnr family transcriptional regulator [Paenibacillus sp. Z3-2]
MDHMSFWKAVPLFRDVNPAEMQEISLLFRKQSYSKGKRIFDEGEESHGAYIVLSGVIKVYRTTNGREHTIDLLGNGDIFGDMELVDPVKVRLLSVVALRESVLYTIDQNLFKQMIAQYSIVKDRLLQLQIDRLISANEKLHEMKTNDARTRLMLTLQKLYSKFGTQEDEGAIINLRLTHQDLADMVGTLRETVTLLLKDLQHQDVVRMKNQKIYIRNVEVLMSLTRGG